MLSHLQAERAHVADLDAQIVDVEHALSALRSQRALVQERLDAYKYPVLTLPNEIISEIFVNFLPTYPDCPPLTGILSPTNLTQICQRWREVAFATPALWRAMKVFEPSPSTQQLLEKWLPRSGCRPISLEIDAISLEIPEDPGAKLFPTSYCVRLERLKISIFQSLIPVIEGSLPLLRHLEISVVNPDLSDVAHPIISGEAPLLCSAILNDATLTFILPWAQLTSLELHRIFPSECVLILQQTSNLVHCSLFLIHDDLDTWPEVTLLHWESLALLEEPVTGYLETFIVPTLRKLRVAERTLVTPIDSLTSFMSKSGCKLQEIAILGPRYVPSHTYHRALPSVKFFFDGTYMYLGEGPDAVTNDTDSLGSENNCDTE